MKVLHLVTKSNWGGAQRCVHDLAVDARAAGLDVAVALGGGGPLATRLEAAGVRVVRLPSLGRDVRLGKDLASARDIWRILGEERPDVLHLHSSKAGGIGALVGRLRGVPGIVFTAHGWDFNNPRRNAWQRFAIRLLHLATVLLAHRTVAVNGIIPEQLGFGWLVGRRFAIIRNGVEVPRLLGRDEARARIAAQSPEAERVIASLGGAPLVGAVAELHRVKGLDTLVEATARLAETRPDLRFGVVVLGAGEERTNLERLILERGVGGRFALAGFTPEAPSHLSAFDAFAMPSRSEGLPMALLEAGAARLPAVASRVGGIPEVIEDGKSGLLVGADDPAALAEAIGRLASDSGLREALGAALAARVAADFSRERASTETLALYRQVVA